MSIIILGKAHVVCTLITDVGMCPSDLCKCSLCSSGTINHNIGACDNDMGSESTVASVNYLCNRSNVDYAMGAGTPEQALMQGGGVHETGLVLWASYTHFTELCAWRFLSVGVSDCRWC